MPKPMVRVLAGLLAAAVLTAHAAPVRGLYEAAIPVSDQGPATRDRALARALELVLVRVTGDRGAAQNGSIAPVLGRANTLVQGYGYESVPGTGLQLRAQFDPRAVNAALQQQGVAVWSGNRPSHLAWIVLKDDGQPRGLLDAASAPTRAPVVAATAAARGLPWSFPQFDANDRLAVSVNDITGQNHESVLRGSRRYNPDQIITARVGREGSRWTAEWTVLTPSGDADHWSSDGRDLDTALAEGIHALADREAERLVANSSRQQALLLQVSGVHGLKDYARLLTYLRGQNGVREAQVSAVQADSIVFRVSVEGDRDRLDRALATGGVLQKQSGGGLFDSTESYVLIR